MTITTARPTTGHPSGEHTFADRRLPQTLAVVRGRAEALGFEVEVADLSAGVPEGEISGIVLQQPGDDGAVVDHTATVAVSPEDPLLSAQDYAAAPGGELA
ncbi:hypothetical protein [Kocuria sp.]|jgi:glycine dehydrogenase|uniref:hypothetical protein n=1 Tax=Kocuria sp. TaxID=1871328 RepID=UPI002810FAD4|nr:hypothetical protein [Kocuria sp.]HST72129.1 hypothetical protein [Kocuria rosea]